MKYRGFTLIETLSVMAILAVILAVSVPFIGNYITRAKQTADKQTLAVLNDALTRYKTQGGNISALTLGSPIENVLSQLKYTLDWNGYKHHVMQTSFTYPARSLTAVGTLKQYRFCKAGSYSSEAIDEQTIPTSNFPYTSGVGYMGLTSTTGLILDIRCTTGWVAFRDPDGNIFIRAASTPDDSATITSLPASSSYTFWSCTSASDSSKDGEVISMDLFNGTLSSLNLQGFSSLKSIMLSDNQLNTISIADLPNLENLNIYQPTLTSLHLADLPKLKSLDCNTTLITSLDVSSLKSLLTISINNNPNIITLSLNGLNLLMGVECVDNASLATLDLEGCNSLHDLIVFTPALTSVEHFPSVTSFGDLIFPYATVNETTLSAFSATLPTVSSGRIFITDANVQLASSENWDLSPTTSRGWTIMGDY